MLEKKIVVKAANGLHARPAGLLVKAAGKYTSEVSLLVNGKKVNAKSIIGIMSLGVKENQEVTIVAEGADEAAAIEDVAAVLESAE